MKIEFSEYTYVDNDVDDKSTYKAYSEADNYDHISWRQKYKNYLEWIGEKRKGWGDYSKYRYDGETVQNLLDNRQYSDAADYLSKYKLKNAEKQRRLENEIINLRRNGRILSNAYSSITDQSEKAQVEFYDAVFRDGGIEKLKRNEYNAELLNDFEEHKRNLGREANTVGIKFKPKVQKTFGIDWLDKDNTRYNIDAFLDNANLSLSDLKRKGITVIKKDGYTELKFKKTHPLANKLLYETGLMYQQSHGLDGDVPSIIAYKGNDTQEIEGILFNKDLVKLALMIDEAKNVKEKYFNKSLYGSATEAKNYSSTIAYNISDNLHRLDQENLSDSEYNRQAKLIEPAMFATLSALGSANYEMYSNKPNEEDTDATLVRLGSADREEIIGLISSTLPKDMELHAMVANGKIGTLVTINEKRNDKDEVIRKRIQVFIPGLFQEEAQARINKDSNARAIQEINSMLDYRYDYDLSNGSTIRVNDNGEFEQDGNVIEKEEAIRNINRDIIISEACSELKFKYMNSKGEIIDPEGYENMARQIAVAAASSLYKGEIQSIDENGEEYSINGHRYSLDDIINKKIDEDKTQYQTWNMIEDIYNMYNKIMFELANFR